MTRYYVKHWEVIGHTHNGAAYCLAHSPHPDTTNEHGDTPAPIFAGDDFHIIDPNTNEPTPYPCDTCGQPITPNQ